MTATTTHTFWTVAGAIVGGLVVAPVAAPLLGAMGLGALAIGVTPGILSLAGAYVGHVTAPAA